MERSVLLAMLLAACAGKGPPAGSTNAERAPVLPGSAPKKAGVAAPPEKARVTATRDRDTFQLGENVLLHYCIENRADEPLEIDVGGDYRGASRSLRFHVTVTDAQGNAMPDPDPEPYSLGGASSTPRLARGESWCQSLPLARYARIDAAGTYTVRIVHDLGWAEGTAPAGEVRVVLATPTEAEAERVVAAMEALPRDPEVTAGKRSPPYADFSALRYGVYLSPLVSRAQKGSTEAIVGIAQIPTAEATRALVSLLGSADRKVARAAVEALAMRLPDPALGGELGPRNVFVNELTEQRRYLVNASWQPDLASSVRAAAHTLLASQEDDDLRSGAFILEALGVAADVPDLVAALSRAIERTRTTPRETNLYPPPRGACQELVRAADIFAARGFAPARPAATPGSVAFWLASLSNKPRSPGWETALGQALRHPIAYLRRLALERMPSPVPTSVVPAIVDNLRHPDVDVQAAACGLVGRDKLADGRTAVLALLAATDDTTLLGIASNTAWSLGARSERADVLAARLAEPRMAQRVLGELIGLFENVGHSSGSITPEQGRVLAKRWASFLKSHAKEIDAGTRLSLDGSGATADLVPPGCKISRKGKPDWP